MRRPTIAPAIAALLLAALAAAPLALPSPARAERLFLPREDEGPWLASDKTLHFAASFAIAVSCRVEGESEATTAGVTIGVGVAKEFYDATLRPARAGRISSWISWERRRVSSSSAPSTASERRLGGLPHRELDGEAGARAG